MTLLVKELKDFLAATTHIKQNGLLPILDYIKWEGTTLTRSNMKTFCVYNISTPATQTVLIEARILKALLDQTSAEQITLTIKGDSVILSDGIRHLTYKNDSTAVFPVMPQAPEKGLILFSWILNSLSKALPFVAEDDLNVFSQVHVYSKDGHTYLYGTDTAKMYMVRMDDLGINFILEAEAIRLLSHFDKVEYSTQGNNDFFRTDKALYSFTKNEFKTPDVSHFYTRFADTPDNNEVDLPQQQLAEFCSLVNSVSAVTLPLCTMGGQIASYGDEARGQDIVQNLSVPVPQLNFIARTMLTCVNAVGSHRARLKKVDKAIVIQSPDLKSVVIALQGIIVTPKQ